MFISSLRLCVLEKIMRAGNNSSIYSMFRHIYMCSFTHPQSLGDNRNFFIVIRKGKTLHWILKITEPYPQFRCQTVKNSVF